MSPLQQYYLRTAATQANVPLTMFRIEDGFQYDAAIKDYLEETGIEELVDIRENAAYIAFVQMIGGFINYEENGYQGLAKEYKKELKYAAGNLMKIQLREMVDRSVTTLSNFFSGFKTFRQL